MIPIILGIAAAAGSLIPTGSTLATVGLTVAGVKLLSKNQKPESFVPDTTDDEELDELIELIRERKLRIRTKV